MFADDQWPADDTWIGEKLATCDHRIDVAADWALLRPTLGADDAIENGFLRFGLQRIKKCLTGGLHALRLGDIVDDVARVVADAVPVDLCQTTC